MRNREADEQWLRAVLAQLRRDEVVYIVPNYYDGGYEVRVGTADCFVDYDAIDSQDTAWLKRLNV